MTRRSYRRQAHVQRILIDEGIFEYMEMVADQRRQRSQEAVIKFQLMMYHVALNRMHPRLSATDDITAQTLLQRSSGSPIVCGTDDAPWRA